MQNGIFLIDKAQGFSSATEISKLKKKLKLNKVGHAGTLDPMATGLLVCLFNSATRLASFAEKGRKIYSGTIRLGTTTSTDDIDGDVLSTSEVIPDYPAVLAAKEKFIGEIEQMPPDISARRIGGVRAYKIARRGDKPELEARKVFIQSFETEAISASEIKFTVECNSGTYIRSIARDLGEALGCGACLSSLRREYSSPFSVQNAKQIEDISFEDNISWTDLFPGMNRVSFDKEDTRKLVTGGVGGIRTRVSSVIGEQLGAEKEQQAGKVIYYEAALERPLGILQNIKGNWEIAVNVHV